MILLLAFLALLIIFHESILVYSLLKLSPARRPWFSISGGILMVSVALLALMLQSWILLVLGFGLYRLTVMLDMGVSALRRDRDPSPLMPVNLLMAAGAGVAFVVEWLWLFGVSYAIFWVSSLLIGKRILTSRLGSHNA